MKLDSLTGGSLKRPAIHRLTKQRELHPLIVTLTVAHDVILHTLGEFPMQDRTNTP
jgi:hypothetical protein